MVKPYYCPRCGKSYTQKECIRNDGKLFCYNCPSVQLQISGTPLMLIGAFLGVMYIIYYSINLQVDHYLTFIFIPACAGMIFLGLVRNNAAAKAAAECATKENDDDEKQGPIKNCCDENKQAEEAKEEADEEEVKPDITEDACCEATADCDE